MGTSTAIQRLKVKTPQLVGVIQHQMQALNDANSEVVKKFGPFVNSFYAPNQWDMQLMGQDVREDIQQESTFSLSNIAKVINEIADNILKGSVASLVGADPKAEVGKSAKALDTDLAKAANATEFMIQAAVAAITSVMGLFDSRATSHVGDGMESHRVAPGLTLHAYSYSALVKADAATGEDSIVIRTIGYKLIYSFAQAEVEQGMALMTHYTNQMHALEEALEVRQGQIDKLIEDPDATLDELTTAQNFIKLASHQLSEYKKNADALAKQYSTS